MRPKIAMWSDYGAPRRKHWRARSRRSSRSSIGPIILAAAVVVVAGVIGISGLYPQIIDSEWVQGMSTRSQRISETASESGISGIYPQIIDSERVQGTSSHSQLVLETAPEGVGMIHEPQPPSPAPVPAWGAEVAGGPTQAKALARYREVQAKYSAILGGREPHFVVSGIVGDAGAVRARAATETRADADKVCAALRAAAWSCDVMHN